MNSWVSRRLPALHLEWLIYIIPRGPVPDRACTGYVRLFIPSPVQLVCKDLEDKDEDTEYGNIEQRVEIGVTVIGRLDEIVPVGKR